LARKFVDALYKPRVSGCLHPGGEWFRGAGVLFRRPHGDETIGLLERRAEGASGSGQG
jgi:hypothetical protein